jgi:hypothetical protein
MLHATAICVAAEPAPDVMIHLVLTIIACASAMICFIFSGLSSTSFIMLGSGMSKPSFTAGRFAILCIHFSMLGNSATSIPAQAALQTQQNVEMSAQRYAYSNDLSWSHRALVWLVRWGAVDTVR